MGVFKYYDISIDNKVLVALSDIGSEQDRATSKTMDEVQQLLDYLFIHSDASYLLVTKSRSRASGAFFLSDPKPYATTFSDPTPQ